MKITAYKCTDTGKIFEHHSEYQTHRKQYLAEQAKIAARQARVAAADTIIDNLRNIASTFDEIAQWVIDNQETLIDRFYANHPNERRPRETKRYVPFRINFVKLDGMQHGVNISNSHSAPKGMPTNWSGGNHHLPTGYPGWHGRILIQHEGDFSHVSRLFSDIGICTGTGGGWAGELSYDVKLWEADWPAMRVYQVLSQNG